MEDRPLSMVGEVNSTHPPESSCIDMDFVSHKIMYHVTLGLQVPSKLFGVGLEAPVIPSGKALGALG